MGTIRYHYTERYPGNPSIDPGPYERSNAITNAESIADPLLLIHGMTDDNVVFENSTVLTGWLQQASIPFEMESRRLHVWKAISNFLGRHVSGER